MTLRSTLASGALMAATAAVVLTTAMAIPGVSSAQPYSDPACQQQQNDRTVGGAILGGLAGAAIGNSVSSGGGRAGGTIIGGVAGAAVGAGVGSATTNCQASYPPPAYDGGPGPYENGPPPGYYDDRYRGRSCGWATREITYPDGASTRDSVRACRDEDGRWELTQ